MDWSAQTDLGTVEAVLDDDPAMAKEIMVEAIDAWSMGEQRTGDSLPLDRLEELRENMIRVVVNAFGKGHQLSVITVPDFEIEAIMTDMRNRGKKVPRCLARLS